MTRSEKKFFMKFLKKEKVFEKFKKAFQRFSDDFFPLPVYARHNLSEYLKWVGIEEPILMAFPWELDNRELWKKIDKKWIKLVVPYTSLTL